MHKNQTVIPEMSTRCQAVNAAFLQEIKDDNRFLDELLFATRDALVRLEPERLNLITVVELLRRLCDRVAMHFTLEEAFGYVDGAASFPKDLSLRADMLRHQHETLYLELCEVVEVAERLLYAESSLSRARQMQKLSTAFSHFYRRLLQHDVAEDDLIMDAFHYMKSAGD